MTRGVAMRQRLLDWYLGGTPDPLWTPLFTFAWGAMALPGERGRFQAQRAAMDRYLREMRW